MKIEKCRCGNPLPAVSADETPFEFCSQECRLTDAAESAYHLLKDIVNAADSGQGYSAIELQLICSDSLGELYEILGPIDE